MRKIILIFIAISCQNVFSQELFVVTDPASNVPANSLAVNVMQSLFKEEMKSGKIEVSRIKDLDRFIKNGEKGLNTLMAIL